MAAFVRHALTMADADANADEQSSERADILDLLTKHRGFLRQTVAGLTDEQARLTPTVSALCLGGLIKHVSQVEDTWSRSVVDGPAAQGNSADAAYAPHR